ncbi:MAG: flippase-like domain-containing protein [Anaerolineae bacterium]|nr:flippase-like domain-containing protein [Anaerolineae bacterium]
MKPRYTVLIGVGIGLLMLVLVLSGQDLDRVGAALAEADYRYVIPTFALIVVGHVTRAFRWRSLLAGRLPLGHAFHMMNIGYLFNGALPFRLGEVARIFLATRAEPPVPAFTTLSTILVERLLDLLTVLGMLGVVLIVLPVPSFIATAGLTLGIGSLAGLIVLVVLAQRHEWAHRLLQWVERALPWLGRWSLDAALDRFVDGLQPLAVWRGLAAALFWSVISWGFSVAGGYILLYAFYPTALWTTVLLFIAMAAFAVSVPYVPGAVGPYEAGVVVALSLTGYGEPEGAAVAFAIILHAVNLSVYLVLGMLGLVQEGVTLGQVARGARDMNPSPSVVE